MSKENENEWFKKHEMLLITTARREREKREKDAKSKAEAEEAKRLRELHWMRCPKCGAVMKEIGEHGVRIDRCTSCEGIYLDRGELEEILLAESAHRRSVFRSLGKLVTGGKLTD